MATLVDRDTSGIFVEAADEQELAAARTRSFKKFALPDAPDGRKRFRVGGQIGPVHYRVDPFDEGAQFEEIDLDVALTPAEDWDAACETNGYQVRFWQSRKVKSKTIRYIAQFRRAGKWLAMAPVALAWENDAGQRELISKPLAVGAPDIDNEANQVTWHNVFGPGLHFRYNLRSDEFFKTLVVEQKSDLPLPTISGPGLRLTIVMALSWHGQSKAANRFAESVEPTEPTDDISGLDNPDEQLDNPPKFSFRDEFDRNTFWLREPRAWDSYAPAEPGDDEVPHSIAVDHRLRRKGSFVFALLSVPAAVLNRPEVVYPVFIDDAIEEESIGFREDAAMSYSSAWPGLTSYYDSYVYLGASTSTFYCSGFRFLTIPIPFGAIISSASLKVCCLATNSDDTDATLHCEDQDDPPTFANSADPVTGRPGYRTRTTDSAQWDIGTTGWTAGEWYTSTNCAAPVQEVIDREGWVEDNDLAILSVNTSQSLPGSAGRRQVYAVNPNWPKFNCSYTAAGGEEYSNADGGEFLFLGGEAEALLSTVADGGTALFAGGETEAVLSAVTGGGAALFAGGETEVVVARLANGGLAVFSGGESEALSAALASGGEVVFLGGQRQLANMLNVHGGLAIFAGGETEAVRARVSNGGIAVFDGGETEAIVARLANGGLAIFSGGEAERLAAAVANGGQLLFLGGQAQAAAMFNVGGGELIFGGGQAQISAMINAGGGQVVFGGGEAERVLSSLVSGGEFVFLGGQRQIANMLAASGGEAIFLGGEAEALRAAIANGGQAIFSGGEVPSLLSLVASGGTAIFTGGELPSLRSLVAGGGEFIFAGGQTQLARMLNASGGMAIFGGGGVYVVPVFQVTSGGLVIFDGAEVVRGPYHDVGQGGVIVFGGGAITLETFLRLYLEGYPVMKLLSGQPLAKLLEGYPVIEVQTGKPLRKKLEGYPVMPKFGGKPTS